MPDNLLDLYLKYRGQIKTGDAILFSAKGSIISAIIQQYTKSIYNHAAGLVKIESFGEMEDRNFIAEALTLVTFNRMSIRLRKYKGEIFWCPLLPEFDPIRPYIAGVYLDHLGELYDFGGLFKNLLGRVSKDAGHFFCSELWYYGIEEGCRKSAGKIDGAVHDKICSKIAEANFILGNKAPTPADIPKMAITGDPVKIL